MIHPQPKPLKRRTVKRKKKAAKRENIANVRINVEFRDFSCRITRALRRFGFSFTAYLADAELAHLRARGMGGNPDLSRDTTRNTVLVKPLLHTGSRSLHSGHLKIRALTEKGADGPLCFEFYEQLPSEIRK